MHWEIRLVRIPGKQGRSALDRRLLWAQFRVVDINTHTYRHSDSLRSLCIRFVRALLVRSTKASLCFICLCFDLVCSVLVICVALDAGLLLGDEILYLGCGYLMP